MSTQWRVRTDSRRTPDEILAFLRTLPGAGETTEFPDSRDRIVEFRGLASAGLYQPTMGQAKSDVPIYGFLRTVTVVLNRVRGADLTAFREAAYAVAFAFAAWDEGCELWFSADDRGIARRCRGRWLVNPHQFDTPTLRALMPRAYDVADAPETNLQKAGWPPVA